MLLSSQDMARRSTTKMKERSCADKYDPLLSMLAGARPVLRPYKALHMLMIATGNAAFRSKETAVEKFLLTLIRTENLTVLELQTESVQDAMDMADALK